MSGEPTSAAEEPQDANGWMITFADLLALLLAFFVLLFSMSSVRQEAWDALVAALAEQLNPVQRWADPLQQQERNMQRVLVARAMSLDYLANLLREKFATDDRLGQVMVHRQDDRLVISLPADLLFPRAGAALAASGAPVVSGITAALKPIANRIVVVGHTDPTPLHETASFASNWELSLARALSLANAMRAAGYPRRLEVLGAADGRYYDISQFLPRALRHRLARRVDLVLHAERAGEGARGR